MWVIGDLFPASQIMIVLTLVVACTALLAWHLHKKNDWVHAVPTLPLKEALQSSEVGDLVLFRAPTVDPLHDAFSAFTHVGLLFEVHGAKHIVETHRTGDTRALGMDVGGVNVYCASTRVSSYDGSAFLLRLNPRLRCTEHNEGIVRLVARYKNVPYMDAHKTHFALKCVLGRPVESGESMFCSQFVGTLLRDLGILPATLEVDCLTPESFTSMHVHKMPVYMELHRIVA